MKARFVQGNGTIARFQIRTTDGLLKPVKVFGLDGYKNITSQKVTVSESYDTVNNGTAQACILEPGEIGIVLYPGTAHDFAVTMIIIDPEIGAEDFASSLWIKSMRDEPVPSKWHWIKVGFRIKKEWGQDYFLHLMTIYEGSGDERYSAPSKRWVAPGLSEEQEEFLYKLGCRYIDAN